MKNPESHLLRLVAMARQVPPQRVSAMSSHLQTRVLAHWQPTSTHAEMVRSLHALFRRALACAALLMLASIVWSYAMNDSQPEDDLALVNLELREDVLQ